MFRYIVLSVIITVGLLGCSTSSDVEEINFIPCENGIADGYPCDSIDLYAHLSPTELLAETKDGVPASLNDIWGWTDPETAREYALVGLTDGVTFVDVTNPSEPIVVGKLLEPGSSANLQSQNPLIANHDDEGGFKQASNWRDMKVYQNHMYVVSEQGTYGLQVFDLTRLRNAGDEPEMFTHDFNYTEFGNAHNVAINKETGYAYVVGSTSGGTCAQQGGLHMVNLVDNPAEPTFAGCYFEEEAGGLTRSRDGYIHDTQCVVYQGPDTDHQGQEICFSSSETSFTITDVENKEQAFTIFNGSYAGNQYSHQGWLTEDHRYFFMNDELDELRDNINTRTYVWDIEDLDSPEMIGFYEHGTISVDHNLYVKGNLLYQANYTSGLRVLDIQNPEPDNISTLGFFNTTPGTDQPGFAGLWSVYPYLSGDKVIVSDIENGLFILRYSH
jgi:choice-of-anchor B domain-containing protein